MSPKKFGNANPFIHRYGNSKHGNGAFNFYRWPGETEVALMYYGDRAVTLYFDTKIVTAGMEEADRLMIEAADREKLKQDTRARKNTSKEALDRL